MRQKLNENPLAQVAVIGVLLLVGGYLLISSLGGGGESTAAGGSGATAGAESSATEEGAAVETETSDLESSAPVAATSAVSAPAAEKLPADVEAAYAGNKTIVLLIYRPGGIDDALVALATGTLSGNSQVALFTAPVKQIARYAAITGPLGVNQAPALVVVSPKRLNGGAAAPATVTYGFQSAADIVQAVVDAGYQGPQLTYAPN